MAYWRLFYHITWSTKDEKTTIDPQWQLALHNVITEASQELGALVYAVGGIYNHVHLSASVPPAISLATFIEKVKQASAEFVNKKVSPSEKFVWQAEYGVISFTDNHLDMVVKYVKDQAKLHKEGKTIRFLECRQKKNPPTRSGTLPQNTNLQSATEQLQWFEPFCELYYHMIWGTKNREEIIDPEWEDSLHYVIAKKAEKLGALTHAVGGVEDHVHLGAEVSPEIDLATFIGQVKGNSSFLVNKQLLLPYDFRWQASYGVFSFGSKMLERVVSYIENQREHHNNKQSLEPLWEQVEQPKPQRKKA